MSTRGKILLKDVAILWTGESNSIQTGCSIFIDDTLIKWIGPHQHLPRHFLCSDHVVEDMKNCLLTPGFINTHHHMYQTLTKCLARDSDLFEWLQRLYPIWQNLTPDMVYKSARFAIAELLLSGCTTTTDHLYLYPNGVQLDDTIRAARELGIRFHPTRGAVSVGESKGGLPPDSLVENEADILQDMKRLINEYHDPQFGSMLRIGLAPCSPFSVSLDLMKDAAKLARQHTNVMLHTHLAENKSDMHYMHGNLKKTVAEFLHSCEWNRSDCWFAHCVMLSHSDRAHSAPRNSPQASSSMDYFANNQLGVAHCPSSNARLASGLAPVRGMLDANIPVAIGVDGSASNDSGNILAEVRQALFTARLREQRASALTVIEALQIATSGGAKVLGRGDIGVLKPGNCADIVAWRLDTPAFAGALHSNMGVLSALVLGHGGDLKADMVLVNGKIVVKNGSLRCEKDLPTIVREHNEAALQLCRSR